jgi:hypothetical protein
MRTVNRIFLFFFVLLVAEGCATIPNGPSVMVLPPPGKPFDQFQAEDSTCRQWSRQQIGLTPQETVNKNTATGAVIGTAVGAGLGAAIGAASGNAGTGAAIGAASGLLVGTTSGANSGQVYGWEAQRRYDIAYQQCMYANGNLIPGMRRSHRVRMTPPPPPPSGMESAPPDLYQPQVAPPPPPPLPPVQ